MSNTRNDETTAQARRLKTALVPYGASLTHTQSLSMLANVAGDRSRHVRGAAGIDGTAAMAQAIAALEGEVETAGMKTSYSRTGDEHRYRITRDVARKPTNRDALETWHGGPTEKVTVATGTGASQMEALAAATALALDGKPRFLLRTAMESPKIQGPFDCDTQTSDTLETLVGFIRDEKPWDYDNEWMHWQIVSLEDNEVVCENTSDGAYNVLAFPEAFSTETVAEHEAKEAQETDRSQTMLAVLGSRAHPPQTLASVEALIAATRHQPCIRQAGAACDMLGFALSERDATLVVRTHADEKQDYVVVRRSSDEPATVDALARQLAGDASLDDTRRQEIGDRTRALILASFGGEHDAGTIGAHLNRSWMRDSSFAIALWSSLDDALAHARTVMALGL